MAPKPAPDRESVRQTTYRQLKDLILSGGVRPSGRLSELALAQRFGVSRTPLREALMKLEKEGLVVGQRNIGYTVAEFDIAAVCQLLVVREALDACAAEQACKNATEHDLAHVREVMEQLISLSDGRYATPADAARSLDLGLHIHKVIAAATKNAPLIRLTDQIYEQLQLALWLEVLWVDFEGSDLEEHRAIADAICTRDAVAAAAAARAHVQSSLRNMTKIQQIVEHRRGGAQTAGRASRAAAKAGRTGS